MALHPFKRIHQSFPVGLEGPTEHLKIQSHHHLLVADLRPALLQEKGVAEMVAIRYGLL